MQTYKLIILSMFFQLFGFSQKKMPQFSISYGKVKVDEVKGYDFLFIESHLYTQEEVSQLKKENKKVYGYISLTEVNKHNVTLYEKLLPYLLKDNTTWNSSFINVSKEAAVAILLQEISEIFEKGIDGILLDNLDNVSKFGEYHELEPYVVELIGRIKQKFPDKDLIQNSGLDLIRFTNPFVSGILTESIYTNYDFENKSYRMRDSIEVHERAKRFSQLIKTYKLHGFVVEYAQDSMMMLQTQKLCNRLKIPYVIKDIALHSN